MGRHRPRAWPARPERPGDRLPRTVAAGRSAEPRPAAAAGQARPRKTPPGRADPDVARGAGRREAKRKLNTGNAATGPRKSGHGRLRRIELNRARATPAACHPTAPMRRHPVADGRPVAPSELGYFGGLFSGRAWGFGRPYQDETGTFTSEPPRRQLTEPPPGYQTPSAAQPYGVTRRIERTPRASGTIRPATEAAR